MIERFWLQLKGMGVMFFLPVLGYIVFIPFCVMILNRGIDNVEDNFYTAQHMCYQFMPILSIIWLYMFQTEYVEGEGREILILGRKITVFSFIYWVLNLPCIWIALQLLNIPETRLTGLFFEMVIASFMICGLAFFLNFAVNSIALSILVVVFYIWLSNVNIENIFIFRDGLQSVQQVSQCFYTVMADGGLLSGNAFFYMSMGALFWLIGMFKAKRL